MLILKIYFSKNHSEILKRMTVLVIKNVNIQILISNIIFGIFSNLGKPLTKTTEQRRQHLLENWYFHCNCKKCLDVESDTLKSSVLCPNCDEGCITLALGHCDKCNFTMKTSLINQHKELRTQICKAIGEQKSIPDYERLYEKAKKVLHPYDGNFFELLDILYKKYNDEIRAQPSSNLYLKRYKIGISMLEYYEKHLPKYSSIKVDYELTLSATCINLAILEKRNNSMARRYLDKAKVHMTKAEDILKISRGENHYDFTNVLPILRQRLNQVELIISFKSAI